MLEPDVDILDDVPAEILASSGGQPPSSTRCDRYTTLEGEWLQDLKTGNAHTGTFTYSSQIDCTRGMDLLFTDADLLSLGAIYDQAPADSCVTSGCKFVGSIDTADCVRCNGYWETEGHFTMMLPPGRSWGAPARNTSTNKCENVTPRERKCTTRVGFYVGPGTVN